MVSLIKNIADHENPDQVRQLAAVIFKNFISGRNPVTN
jgi:hypothetical protein